MRPPSAKAGIPGSLGAIAELFILVPPELDRDKTAAHFLFRLSVFNLGGKRQTRGRFLCKFRQGVLKIYLINKRLVVEQTVANAPHSTRS